MNISRFNKRLYAVLTCLIALIVGGTAFTVGKTVYAVEAPVDLSYSWHTEGGTVTSLGGAGAPSATTEPSYQGNRVTFTPNEGETDGVLYFNGLVDPTLPMYLYMDNAVGTPDMNGFAIAYEDPDDPTKQLTFISTLIGEKSTLADDPTGFQVAHTVALTDQLELEKVDDQYWTGSFMKIAGTDQFTMGTQNGTSYDSAGWRLWYNGTFSRYGMLYNGETAMSYADGTYRFNPSTPIATVTDAAYLEASSKDLPDGEIKMRYTSEHVGKLFSGRVKMKFMFFGITAPSVSFHIRGMDGSWMEGGAYPGHFVNKDAPLMEQVATEVYENVSYPLDHLVKMYGLAPSQSNLSGFIGGDGSLSNGAYVSYGNFANGDGTFTYIEPSVYTFGAAGTRVKLVAATTDYSHYSNETVFEYEVAVGEPRVTAVDRQEIDVVNGTVLDLTKFVDLWYVGESCALFAEVGGVAIADLTAYAVTEDVTIRFYAEDSRGNISEDLFITIRAKVFDTTTKSVDQRRGEMTYFAIPPADQYSFGLFHAGDDYDTATPLTQSIGYSFTESDTYAAVYDIGGNRFVIEYQITVKKALPTIVLNGAYKNAYLDGQTVEIISAIASNDYEDVFDIERAVLKDGEPVAVTGDSLIVQTGHYVVHYRVDADGETVVTSCEFEVVTDTEDPRLILKGRYLSEYQGGMELRLIEAVARDNYSADMMVTIAVYRGKKALVITNGAVLLDRNGDYRIVYAAVDESGNTVTEEFLFKVTGASSNFPLWAAIVIPIAIVGAGAAVWIVISVKRRKIRS